MGRVLGLGFILLGLVTVFFGIAVSFLPLSVFGASAGPFSVQASGISPASATALVGGFAFIMLGSVLFLRG